MAPVAILCRHRGLPASWRLRPDAPYFERETALDLDRPKALLDALERRDAVLPPSALLAWTGDAGSTAQGDAEPALDPFSREAEMAIPGLQRPANIGRANRAPQGCRAKPASVPDAGTPRSDAGGAHSVRYGDASVKR